jgi:hypothetical protein
MTKAPIKFNTNVEKKKRSQKCRTKKKQDFNNEIYDKLPSNPESPISYNDFMKATMEAAETVVAGEGCASNT